jgi:hypothetical protein
MILGIMKHHQNYQNKEPKIGARTIRCRTIRRGQFVADYSLHGQFVARQFVAGQFVARTIRCMDNSSPDNSSHGQFVAMI